MPTPKIYAAFATRLRTILPLRNILIGSPLVLGLALFDNAWGQSTYHIAGRILTSLVILWMPITAIALFFAPRQRDESIKKPIRLPWLKAAICTVVTVLSIAFLCLVQAQDWLP